ncbi:MAG: hypothetical protein AAFQ67_02470 [Pseudomonadota bacterium]
MRNLSIILAAAFLSACATFSFQTPHYGPADGPVDEGYSEEILDNGLVRVSFAAPAASGARAARDFALLRAAELTLIESQEWFEVVTDLPIPETYAPALESPGAPLDGDYQRENIGLPDTTLSDDPEFQRPDTSSSRRAALAHVLEIRYGSGEQPEDSAEIYDAKALTLFLFQKYSLNGA